MALKIGPMLKKAREKAELTREQVAKKLGIKPGYVAQLENSAPVTLSDELAEVIIKKLHAPRQLLVANKPHNKRVSLYRAKLRRARQKKAA